MEAAQIAILAGFAIGLVYGAVGLLSGFCLMSSMREFLAEGDGRMVRAYALAIAVAIAVSRFLAGSGTADLGKSIRCAADLLGTGAVPRRVSCSATAWCCPTAAARARWCCSAAAICAPSWW